MQSSWLLTLLMAVSVPPVWLHAGFEIWNEGTTADSLEVGFDWPDPD